MADWERTVAAARLRAVHDQPYLSAALFALTPVAVPQLGTFAVDRHWRLYVDPVRCDEWSVEEIAAVLVHEVHHVLRDHAGRAEGFGVGEQEAHRFNVAGDLEINDDLTGLPLPSGGLQPDLFGFETGQLAETYFGWLDTIDIPVGWECGSGAHGVACDWDRPRSTVSAVSSAEGDLIRQQVASAIRARGQGTVPSGLLRWAEAFLEPKVRWQLVLAGAVRSTLATSAGTVDYTFTRPNRRTPPTNRPAAVLPAMRRPEPVVAVVVDTSGSMSAQDLGQALAEIRGVLRSVGVGYNAVAVLSCDSAVHATQLIFTADQVTLYGGGGTDVSIGIAAAAELRPRPNVVVVVTDGMTPWPNEPPRGVRVVVALLGRHGSAPDWAEKVEIG